MKLKLYILLFFAIFFTQKSFSQAIFSGGNNDGFTVSCYAQADNPTLAIFSGGNDDGFGFSCIGGVGTEVPLPIELINLTASVLHNYVVLEWQTATEINNDYFTIERTQDVTNFQIIGTVDGAGNSNQTINYSFIDTEPLNGISYYRLKQTDFDGKFKYSKIISVKYTNNFIGELNIYPNPVSNELIIEINENKSVLNFEIINSIGSVIYKGNLVNNTIVQTNNFASGIYLIRFTNGKTSEFKKLIKSPLR